MLTRRALISQTISSAGAFYVPASVLRPGAVFAEPVTLALTIGSAVAGMVAANNRGDAIGPYLEAINRKQDIIIDQLTGIQNALATVLKTLADIQTHFDETLRIVEVERLNNAVYGAVIGYFENIWPRRKNYASDEDFRRQTGVMDDIQSLLNRLNEATDNLKAKRAYGPTVGLVIPPAFHLKHSLLLLRGDSALDIVASLRPSFEWLNQVDDLDVATSAARYRVDAAKRHDELWKAASETDLGKALGMAPGTALLDCFGIDDYMAEHTVTVTCRTLSPRQMSFENEDDLSFNDRSAYKGMPNAIFADVGTCYRTIAERRGPQARIFQNFNLTENEFMKPVKIGNQEVMASGGFKMLSLDKQKESGILLATDPAVPKTCTIRAENAPSPDDRASWLKTHLENSAKQKEFDALAKLVADINTERARISLATISLTTVAKARSDLKRIISDLGG